MLFLFCFFVFLFFFIGLVRSSLLSILSLVFGFVIAAVYMYIFNAEFLALTYVVVYIGSISMLFLFLIMMIDPRTISELFREIVTFKSFFSLLVFIFVLSFVFFKTEAIFFYDLSYSTFAFVDWFRIVFSEINIVSFSQMLFSSFAPEILLISLCLFIGIIGPLLIFMRDND